jgi:hypothetical protein
MFNFVAHNFASGRLRKRKVTKRQQTKGQENDTGAAGAALNVCRIGIYEVDEGSGILQL